MTLLELLRLLKRRLALVLGLSLALALVGGAYGMVHAASPANAGDVVASDTSTTIYVQPRVVVDENGNVKSSATTSEDILSGSVRAYITSDTCVSATAQQLGLKDLASYAIEVGTDPDAGVTRIITITVTDGDPEDGVEAYQVANALAQNAGSVSQTVQDVQAVSVVNKAKPSEKLDAEESAAQSKAGPSIESGIKYGLVGLVGGLLVAISLVVLADALDVRVRDAAELEELTGLPVIATLPTEGGR